MSRQNITRIIFAAAIIQMPFWLQARSRNKYLEQLTSGARLALATNPSSNTLQDPTAPASIDWPLLRELEPNTKTPSSVVKAFNNRKVTISGYMVPLEDKQQNVAEFLLVPSPMSCIHVPPPTPQQIIYVVSAKVKDVAVTLGAIQVTGTFYVASNTTPNSSSLYTMEAESVVLIK